MDQIREYADLFLRHCKLQRRLTDHSIKGYSIDLRMFIEYLESRTPPVTECNRVTKETLHSTISTTQIYLHTSDEEKRRILASKHPREQIRHRR